MTSLDDRCVLMFPHSLVKLAPLRLLGYHGKSRSRGQTACLYSPRAKTAVERPVDPEAGSLRKCL